MSLRYRIAITIFVLEALLIGVVLWRTLDLTRSAYDEQVESYEVVLLDLLSDHSRQTLIVADYVELQSYLGRIDDPRIVRILVADYRNRVVAASDPTLVGSDLPTLEDEGHEQHWRVQEIRTASAPLGTLAVLFSDREAHDSFRHILRNALFVALAGMGIIAAVSLLMGHLLTRRLVVLGRAARRLEGGDLSVRLDLRGGDEITQVGVAFDEMARSLEESVTALQEKETQMRLLTDSLPVGISYVDQDIIIRFANHQLSKWLGWSPEAMLGRHLADIMAEDQYAEAVQGLEAALGGHIVHRERPMVFAGRSVHLDVVNVPDIGSDGAVRGVYSLLRDISGRKAREKERERMVAELGFKNAELEQITYTVSHDLKSPLITILSCVEYLENEIPDGERASEDLDRLRHAAEAMDRMLDAVLDVARLGSLEMEQKPVDMDELVADTVRLVTGRIASAGAVVEVDQPLPTVSGDRRFLQRVLQNLIDNGVKFSAAAHPAPTDDDEAGDPTPPTLHIGVRPFAATDPEATFFVRDNGRGLDPDQLAKVFELFRQVDRKQEGTGVGLAIVQRIIEVHGGRVWAESKGVGHGTAFCFTLPLRRRAKGTETPLA